MGEVQDWYDTWAPRIAAYPECLENPAIPAFLEYIRDFLEGRILLTDLKIPITADMAATISEIEECTKVGNGSPEEHPTPQDGIPIWAWVLGGATVVGLGVLLFR